MPSLGWQSQGSSALPLKGWIHPDSLWGLGPRPPWGCGTGLSPRLVGQRQG